MSVNIPLPKIVLNSEYLIEFIVKSPYDVTANLMTQRDPTVIDTQHVIVDSIDFCRTMEYDEENDLVLEGTEESTPAFVIRVLEEVKEWAEEAVEKHKSTQELANALLDEVRNRNIKTF